MEISRLLKDDGLHGNIGAWDISTSQLFSHPAWERICDVEGEDTKWSQLGKVIKIVRGIKFERVHRICLICA